jgi:hypothetical protein
MNSHDYVMSQGGGLSDRLPEDGRGGSPSRADAWGADHQRLEDLLFDSGSQRHAGYRTPAGDPRAEDEAFWPSYQLYQPEMAPPARYQRLLPPPAACSPALQPEPVRYEDGLMTQALFDWTMRNIPETQATPLDDWT